MSSPLPPFTASLSLGRHVSVLQEEIAAIVNCGLETLTRNLMAALSSSARTAKGH